MVAASERRFRALVNNGDDVIIVTDRNGVIEEMSDSVTHVLGRVRAGATGPQGHRSRSPRREGRSRGRARAGAVGRVGGTVRMAVSRRRGRVATHRGVVDQPVGAARGRRRRVEHAGRDRTAPARDGAAPSCVPRFVDRTREPGVAARPHRPCDGPPRHVRSGAHGRSTSTGSSTSTTASVTWPVTTRSPSSPTACAASAARETPWRASAATSSRCSSKTPCRETKSKHWATG